ncbi:MAG: hypothetical protein M1829_004480 [Trizodia sp. TS-e1964]|nr:MAG: hypothetical protein M1829_004480 [Trizodia sp. TS-e1964]
MADKPDASMPSDSSKKRKRSIPALAEIEVDLAAPEPPSKKALRKANKGKPTKSAAPGKVEIGVENTAEVEPPKRSNYGIWAGNLSFTTTKADLKKFLVENSEIKESLITRIHLPSAAKNSASSATQPQKPRSIGYAYVDFSTPEALDSALALSESLLAGRRILIKNAKSFEGRPEKPTRSKSTTENCLASGNPSGKPPNKRIFVGNLGFDVTEEDLQENFSKCGDITNIHLATFEDSGKCKGFAWVVFKEVEAAISAIRGWVKFKTTNDSSSSTNSDSDTADEEEKKDTGKTAKPKGKKKQAKMRKWWVNRIKGRPLRMEFAEDKETRYNKRYGKGRPKDRGSGASEGGAALASAPKPKSFSSAMPRKVDARTIKPGAALANAPRATAAIVVGKGTKTVFD